jgi:hypothetical protein
MMNFFPSFALDVKYRCRTKGQSWPTKERKTCSWFDKNGEKNYGSTKRPKKQERKRTFALYYIYSIGEYEQWVHKEVKKWKRTKNLFFYYTNLFLRWNFLKTFTTHVSSFGL